MSVYDCFIFFNELDLLEIRLDELDSIVDYFVIVEATKTHSGKSKALVFGENRERFHKYTDRIIHIVVDDMPELVNNNRWVLENYQRRCISRGLIACKGEDIIVISDVDEIPDRINLSNVISILERKSLTEDWKENVYRRLLLFRNRMISMNASVRLYEAYQKLMNLFIPYSRIYTFRQRLYEYYFNGYVHDNWPGSRIVRFSTFAKVFNRDANYTKEMSSGRRYKFIRGGWHFSYLGGADRIVEKIQAFAHSEYDTDTYTDKQKIADLVEKGENIFGKVKGEHSITYIEIDETYPEYIQKNRAHLKGYIKEIQRGQAGENTVQNQQ